MPFLVHISDFVTMDIFQVPFHVRSPQGTATSQSFQTDLTNNLTLPNPMKIIPDFRSLGPATRYWLWKREGRNFQGFSVSNSNYYSFQKYIQLSGELQIICLVHKYSTSSVSLELLQALFAALLALNICGIQP